MKKTSKNLKIFIATLLADVLLIPGIARGIAVIDTLDFSLTGSRILDCDILGKIELEHDPSWNNEEFYVHMVEQYVVNTSEGGFANVEAYRESINNSIKDEWDTFNSLIYKAYASEYHDDYYSRSDYYNDYTDELKSDYYRAFIFDSLEISPWGFDDINTYDVVANYCSTGHAPITTTYGDYGYSGYIKLGNREVAIDEDDLLALNNGYAFHEDGFGDLKVELTRIDDTTIKAKYTLKNLTGVNTNYGIAFYTDVEFGDNDDAAISKTDRSFTITQDNNSEWYESTFGAQFHIQLDPVATTTYIGYYGDAEEYRWANSEKDYYTAADDEDTGLAYSWQGQINTNETKVFSATYTMNIAETFDNYFYYLEDDYSNPDTVASVDGGGLYLPELGLSANIGYHREWNTKIDGTGISYQPYITIIANKDRASYYEKDVPNEVSSYPNTSGIYDEYNIVVTDEMRERYKSTVENSFSNFNISINLMTLAKEDIEDVVEAGIIPESLVTDVLLGEEDRLLDSAFIFGTFRKEYIDQDGYFQEEDFEDDELPITMRIKLTDEQVNKKGNFKLVSIAPKSEDEYIISEVPIRFNGETNELFFEINSVEDISKIYTITYIEIPEIPKVPNTGSAKSNRK